MTLYNPSVRRLWTLGNGGTGLTLSGAGTQHFGPFNTREVCDLGLYVFAAGTSTGTSPTLDAWVDALDPAGNVFLQVAKITQLTSAPNYSSASVGLHIASTGSLVLPEQCQVTVVLGGTTPVFPNTSITLYGR